MMRVALLLAQASENAEAAENAEKTAAWLSNLACPLLWSMILAVIGLWLLLPSTVKRFRRAAGWLLVAVSFALLAAYLPRMSSWFYQGLFWVVAGATLLGAVATISMRSPVYSAVWFAMTLLATAGLFLYQQAQFLAVATVAVYAGAIVVMFLFVLMLAEPQGYTYYDRITWGPFTTLFAVVAAVAIIGGMTYQVTHLHEQAAVKGGERTLVEPLASGTPAVGIDGGEAHMAGLGGELFGRQLISVEVAGTLLLVALVGALAIVIQGRQPHGGEEAAETRGGPSHG